MLDVRFPAETEIQRSLDLVAAGRCYGAVPARLGGACRARLPVVSGLSRQRTGPGFDRLRIEAYLRIWNALHPAARASILDD